MNKQITAVLRGAMRFAIKDLYEVAQDAPKEVLPKEEQIRSAIYAYLKQEGWRVHVEAAYRTGKGKECDLRARFRKEEECWIELKRGWSGPRGSGWNNKPKEQDRSWRADVRKLRGAPRGAARVFMLFVFFGRDPGKEKCKLMDRIKGFGRKGTMIYRSACPDFDWPSSGTLKLQAWAWSF